MIPFAYTFVFISSLFQISFSKSIAIEFNLFSSRGYIPLILWFRCLIYFYLNFICIQRKSNILCIWLPNSHHCVFIYSLLNSVLWSIHPNTRFCASNTLYLLLQPYNILWLQVLWCLQLYYFCLKLIWPFRIFSSSW